MHKGIVIVSLAVSGFGFVPIHSEGVELINAEAMIEFPDQITFTIQARSDVNLEIVELEYGLPEGACVTDINRVIPEDFEPETDLDTTWTWNMRQTGSLPPGARIWWRWHLIDEAGNELRTETKWLTWIDDEHDWQNLTTGNLILHWYSGSEDFARRLLDAAVNAQTRLEVDIGTQLEGQVQIFIYADTEDMRDAVLFEAGWTGAQAYPNYGILIIGVNERNLDWGLETIAHELAHVIVGNVVDHCYSDIPTWLGEGLAVYAEGELNPTYQELLAEAISGDRLFSVRSLSDGFTEQAARAYLSYAQSYSIVAFLIETYGQQKMLDLLDAFQAGYKDDHALLQVYGFDADGLESEWREAVSAPAADISLEDVKATPTIFPTIQPFSEPASAITLTPLPEFTPTPTPISRDVSYNPLLGSFCLILAGLFAAIGLLVIRIRKLRKKRQIEGDTDG